MNIENTKGCKNRLKQWISHNSLFFKIISIVVLAMVTVSIAISMILVYISDEVYVETYSHANNKIISQISNEYYFLHEDVMEILGICGTSTDVKNYMSDEPMTPQSEAEVVYRLTKSLKNTSMIGTDLSSNLLLVGKNGKTYFQNNAGMVDPYETILNSELVKNAIAYGKEVIYQYDKDGFTSNLKDTGVIHVIKIIYDDNRNVLGMADVMIKQSDFSSIYDSLIDEANNNLYIIDEQNMVLSSNITKQNGTQLKNYHAQANKLIENKETLIRNVENEEKYTLLAKDMYFNGLRIISVINESQFVGKVNRISTVFYMCLFIVAIMVILVFLFIKKAMNPIHLISDKMQFITKGDFSNHIDVKGSGQVRELEETYNYMLDGLNSYVDELMRIEEEKRLSDIHALQMQINPHFIYNTLTSIKFLVWKGDKEKATATIDAFIQLLRMTIGNQKESITLEEEIHNVENYIKIQQTRYGDHIKHRLFIDVDAKQYYVPKMLIQPFIENSFIHAFDDSTSGVIDVYAKILRHQLVIEIIDNGCGMGVTQVDELLQVKDKDRRFSGIGIQNVDARIKLLYGKDYGVNISSAWQKGTIVTITLPVMEQTQDI
ncbi:cache domain-containing sensor histidine kinase [Amedibacillus sp. YH-ame10]